MPKIVEFVKRIIAMAQGKILVYPTVKDVELAFDELEGLQATLAATKAELAATKAELATTQRKLEESQRTLTGMIEGANKILGVVSKYETTLLDIKQCRGICKCRGMAKKALEESA